MKNNRRYLSGVKRNLWQNRFQIIMIMLLMVPIFFAARSFFVSFAQTGDPTKKKITKGVFKDEPIEVVGIETDGETVKLDESFTREGDWLNDLTFTVRNKSEKPIVEITLFLYFPETWITGPVQGDFIHFGVNPQMPKLAGNKPVWLRPDQKPQFLPPNKTGEIRLLPEIYTGLKNLVEMRHLLSSLTEAKYQIQSVYFDDGTYWFYGTNYRPDPERPGKFVPIPKSDQVNQQSGWKMMQSTIK